MEEFFKLDTTQKIEVVKYKFQCTLCLRKFEKKHGHLCNKQFRKRGLTWIQENGN